ncbi:hypothetical protein GQ43DRAFT_373057 [Delitschia confertaspora ATCC 74209]|uniref:Transcription factor hoxa13 n=1 Tax=Delitschia confertaspora ATCC 74209 TaxID=1513339 RepID=A0A9P4JJU7_9PLEO|nr:hypothetical protein GQ43DRAFT_373057 [Delitschia confertaspora ATCC 74209]
MAAQMNGKAKKPKKSSPNGQLNGHVNGHTNGSLNRHIDNLSGALVRPRTHKPKKTMMGSLFSTVIRLFMWYLTATLLFRCPSSVSQLSDTTPQVCSPWLRGRAYITPYLDPYFQAYVAPQVQKVRPYVDSFDTKVVSPVSHFSKTQYTRYGAHRVEQAKILLDAQWDKHIRPQLEKAQTRAKDQYEQHLAPHVNKVTDVTAPYYHDTKTGLSGIYHSTLLPAYKTILPFSQTAYAHGHHIVAHIIFPYVRSGKDMTFTFISRTLWPQVRILYAANVEPQLVRIRERLGRYRDGKKLEAALNAAESSGITSVSGSPSVPTIVNSASVSEKLSDIWSENPHTTHSSNEAPTATQAVESAKSSLSEVELREKLNNDLRQWQTKFATAADKGSEDLQERVEEITKRQVENGVHGHGAALLVQLEEVAKTTVKNYKNFIKQTVEDLPEDATDEQLEAAYEKCVAQSREQGLAAKEKAQAVRTWKNTYDEETDDLVKAAVENTLSVLRRIHDLGLQEVGLRWAWTDGVTYQDWQNYHKLKDTLTEWEAEVEAVGSRHEGLRVAHEESKKLEDHAMATASDMVHELIKLKEVSKWKIWAGDSSDDFSDRKVPVRPLKAAQSVVKNVEEAVSKVSESIVGAVSSASANEDVERVVTKITSSVSVVGISSTGQEDAAATPIIDSVKSKASEVPKKVFGGAMAFAVAEAREIIFDDEIDDSDDTPYSEKVARMVAGAGDRAADLTRAVSEALMGPASTQGSMESVTSLASEQYLKALSAASSIIYGTEQQAIESMTSVASDKFAQAVTAASYAIYGTPTPTAIFQSIHVGASSQYDNAVRQAQEQYSKAMASISEIVSGTTTPAYAQMMASVEKAYSDSVATASGKLKAALQYTDSVKSYAAGPTPGAFESVSSVAASKLSEGLSLASAQFSSQPTPVLGDARRRYYESIGLAHARYAEFLDTASSMLYGPQQGTFESIASVVSQSAGSLASAVTESAGSLASEVTESAGSFASEVSSSVIGTETPWMESVASQASQNWDALISKASSQVYGAPTPFAESMYSRVGSYGAQATAQAVEQYAAVQALISELVVGKEPDFTESVMSRFSSVYYTGYPAVVSAASSYASENYESASSYASENYEAASSYAADAYASASSVVSSVFTPPPAIETILSQANDQINAAVESVSVQVYGTSKGTVEQASESVASAYSSVQSKASEAIYGTPQAQAYMGDVAASAQKAISEAIFGTPTSTGYVASVTKGAASAYSSVASAANEGVGNVASAVSSAVYGPEQGAMESASSRLAASIEVANSKISEMLASAASGASEAASTVSSAATAATQRVKDEL